MWIDSFGVTKDLWRLVLRELEALCLLPKLVSVSLGPPVTKRTVRTLHQAAWLINSEEGKTFSDISKVSLYLQKYPCKMCCSIQSQSEIIQKIIFYVNKNKQSNKTTEKKIGLAWTI